MSDQTLPAASVNGSRPGASLGGCGRHSMAPCPSAIEGRPQRDRDYRPWLERLPTYFCECSRRTIREGGGNHPLDCRDRASTDGAVRFVLPPGEVTFVDRVHGELTVDAPRLDGAGVSYDAVMEPLFGDNYAWQLDGAGAQITFIRDQGEPRWMRTRFFVADKQEVTSTSAPASPCVACSLVSSPAAARQWKSIRPIQTRICDLVHGWM